MGTRDDSQRMQAAAVDADALRKPAAPHPDGCPIPSCRRGGGPRIIDWRDHPVAYGLLTGLAAVLALIGAQGDDSALKRLRARRQRSAVRFVIVSCEHRAERIVAPARRPGRSARTPIGGPAERA